MTPKRAIARRVVFSLGLPASGKTTCLRRRFACEKAALIDLDEEIKKHPSYNRNDKASVYDNKEAYDWANDCVQRRFQYLMKMNSPLIAIDGTGTHISRQKERIGLAKSFNYHTVLLHVHVPLDVALERNTARNRVVPCSVMQDYHQRLEVAVKSLKGKVDEYILDDNTEDDFQSLEERWGS